MSVHILRGFFRTASLLMLLIGLVLSIAVGGYTDRVAAQEMIEKSGQMGVPVVDIDGNIFVGFQPEEFDKVL